MERSPLTLSPRKFARMNSPRQHQILAQLARICLEREADLGLFQQRAAQLCAQAELDHYQPPHWLSPPEALQELGYFHQLRAGEGASAEIPPQGLSWRPRLGVTVVLDGVRSPYNLGSILRLIDNFGMAGLVHANPSLDLQHPRLVRAACGAQAWIPVTHVSDLEHWLGQATMPLIALEDDPAAIPLHRWQPPSQALLLLGNETYGISAALRSLCSQIVRIPMYGFKKSMNVSHAFAVVAQRMVEILGEERS